MLAPVGKLLGPLPRIMDKPLLLLLLWDHLRAINSYLKLNFTL